MTYDERKLQAPDCEEDKDDFDYEGDATDRAYKQWAGEIEET